MGRPLIDLKVSGTHTFQNTCLKLLQILGRYFLHTVCRWLEYISVLLLSTQYFGNYRSICQLHIWWFSKKLESSDLTTVDQKFYYQYFVLTVPILTFYPFKMQFPSSESFNDSANGQKHLRGHYRKLWVVVMAYRKRMWVNLRKHRDDVTLHRL